MNYPEYAALEGVNWSSLKWLWSGSPLHYRYHADHPKADVDTPARVRFRAVHTAILEPEKFAEEYPIYTGGNRSGNIISARIPPCNRVAFDVCRANVRAQVVAGAKGRHGRIGNVIKVL